MAAFPSIHLKTNETNPAPGVRLLAQAFQVSFPSFHLDLVWNRPLAVVTTTPDGQELRHRVIDVTRIAQIGFGIGALLVFFILQLIRRIPTQENN